MSEPTKAVFLSYAAPDAEALRAGVGPGYDQRELAGGSTPGLLAK